MLSTATTSKLGSPSARDSPSNPTLSNNYLMDMLPISPLGRESKTYPTSSNSMPPITAPLKTSYSLCLTGWTAPYKETLTSSRLCLPRLKDWRTGDSLKRYIVIETLTPTSMKSAERWRSWRPPLLYSKDNKSTATITSMKHTSSITSLTLRCLHATQKGSPSNMGGVLHHSLIMLPGSTKCVGMLSRGGVMSPAFRTT